jgi:hypothetical protein
MTNHWGVYLFWRLGMSPVTFCIYIAFTSDAAFAYAETLPFANNKKRGWFVKQVGVKKRHYKYKEPYEPPVAQPIALFEPEKPEGEIFVNGKFIKVWSKEQKRNRRL